MAADPAEPTGSLGERVVIRPVRVEDSEAANEIRRQPSVLAFTLAIPSEGVASSRAFIEGLRPDDHVLVATVDDQLVGMAGLHVRRGKERHTGLIGMMVHEAYQGRGVGRQLLAALLDLADNYLGLVRVELEVLVDNTRAIRLYERFGFEHEGRKRKAIFRRGRYDDVLVMARLR